MRQQDGVRPEKGNTPNLDNFSRDLTQMARDGKLDPVIGREREMKRVIQSFKPPDEE